MKLLLVYRSNDVIPYLITYCADVTEFLDGDFVRLIIQTDDEFIEIEDWDYYDLYEDDEQGKLVDQLKELATKLVGANR